MPDTEQIIIEVDGLEQAVQHSSELEKDLEAVRKLSKDLGFDASEKEIKEMRAEIDKFAKSLNTVQKEVKTLQKNFNNVDKTVTKTGRTLKTFNVRNLSRELASTAGLASSIGGTFGGIVGGAAASLIETAIGELTELLKVETQAQLARKETIELFRAGAQEVATASVTFREYFSVVEDTTRTEEERSEALDAIAEIYPEVLEYDEINIDNQEDLNVLYEAVNKQIVENAIAKQQNAALTELLNAEITKEITIQEKAEEANNSFFGALQQFNAFLGGDVLQNVAGLTVEQQNLARATAETEKEIGALGDALNTISDPETRRRVEELVNTLDIDLGEFSDVLGGGTGARSPQARAKKTIEALESIELVVDELKSAEEELLELSVDGTVEQIDAQEEYVEALRNELAVKKSINEEDVKRREEIRQQTATLIADIGFNLEDVVSIATQLSTGEQVGQAGDIRTRGFESTLIDEQIAALAAFEEASGRQVTNLGAAGNQYQILLDLQGRSLEQQKDLIFEALQASDDYFSFINELEDRDIVIPLIQGQRELLAQLDAEFNALGESFDKNDKQFEEITKRSAEIDEQVADNIRDRENAVREAVTANVLRDAGVVNQLLDAANVTNIQELTEAAQREIEAELDKSITDIETEADAYLNEVRALVGDAFQFEVEGGVVEVSEDAINALFEFDPATAVRTQQFIDDSNEKIQLAIEQRNQAIERLDVEAVDRAIRNYKNRNEIIERELNLNFERQVFTTKQAYEDLLKEDREFFETRMRIAGEVTDEERAGIIRDRDAVIDNIRQTRELELQLRTDRYLEELSIIREEGGDVLLATEEFYLERDKIIRKYELDEERAREDFAFAFDRETVEQDKATFQQYLAELQSLAQTALQIVNNVFEMFANRQQRVIDNLNQQISNLTAQISESEQNLDSLEDDLEGKRSGRRDAVLRGIELERQRQEQLAEEKIRLDQKLREEELKLARQRKAQAITQAAVNGALAITNIAANLIDPTPVQAFKIAAIAAQAALTATQIGVISSQQFADGGFTGDGLGFRDSTGEKVAGVVHHNEWVAPRWQVESPKYRPIIEYLESARSNGFADGGFTTPNFGNIDTATQFGANPDIMRTVMEAIQTSQMLAQRPIYTNVTDISNLNRVNARRTNAVTIGR